MNAPAKQLPRAVLNELRKCGIPPDAFEVFLAGSGVSGTSKQLELVHRLYAARQQYMLRTMGEKTKPPNPEKRHSQLVNISKTASRLLKHLGITDPLSAATAPFHDGMNVFPVVSAQLLPELQNVAIERRSAGAKMDAITRLKSLLNLLSDLTEAGERSAKTVARQIKSKRGGARRKGDTAKTALIKDLIEIYAAVNPLSRGSTHSLNKRLKTFIRAGISAVIARPVVITESGKQYEPYIDALTLDKRLERLATDTAIRSVFDRWKLAQTKTKT